MAHTSHHARPTRPVSLGAVTTAPRRYSKDSPMLYDNSRQQPTIPQPTLPTTSASSFSGGRGNLLGASETATVLNSFQAQSPSGRPLAQQVKRGGRGPSLVTAKRPRSSSTVHRPLRSTGQHSVGAPCIPSSGSTGRLHASPLNQQSPATDYDQTFHAMKPPDYAAEQHKTHRPQSCSLPDVPSSMPSHLQRESAISKTTDSTGGITTHAAASSSRSWAETDNAAHHMSTPSMLPSLSRSSTSSTDDDSVDREKGSHQSGEDMKVRRRLDEARQFASKDVGTSEPPAQAEPQKNIIRPDQNTIRTFSPSRWLTDDSITYAYSLLNAGELRAASGPTPNKGLPEGVLLIEPATSFWLGLVDDQKELDEARRSLKIDERMVVLCPINDARDGSRTDAGTHWSLLACWREAPGSRLSFVYYDSLRSGIGHGPSAPTAVETLASRLAASRPVQVSSGHCALQANFYDCGIYVILFSEIIAAAFLEARERRPLSGVQHSRLSSGTSPCWEERLSRITPREATDLRTSLYKRSSAAAVGGA